MSVCAIYDHKAKVYSQPFYALNHAVALRSFRVIVDDKSTVIGSSPKDFSCFALADFNDVSGDFKMFDKPVLLAHGSDFSVNKEV